MSTALTLVLDLATEPAPPAPAKPLTRTRLLRVVRQGHGWTLALFSEAETPVVLRPQQARSRRPSTPPASPWVQCSLFTDVEPAPASGVVPVVEPAPARLDAEARTLSLFSDDEIPVVALPPAPVVPRVFTRQATLRTFAEAPAQYTLDPTLDRDTGHDEAFERDWAERHGLTEAKPRRHLRLVPDAGTPAATCPPDPTGCPHTHCRKHLGASRELRGQRFACSVHVARELGELTDAEVAHVMGEDESFVQSTWMTLVRREPILMAWLWSLVYDHAPTLRSNVRPEWFNPELLAEVQKLGTGPRRRFTFGRKPGPQPRLRRVS